MKNLNNNELKEYLSKIKTETLLAYGVYQIEAGGLELFEYIKGDKSSIMGLPIDEISKYVSIKMSKKKFYIIGKPLSHSLSPTLHNYWFKKYNIDADYNILGSNSEIQKVVKEIKEKRFLELMSFTYKRKLFHILTEL